VEEEKGRCHLVAEEETTANISKALQSQTEEQRNPSGNEPSV